MEAHFKNNESWKKAPVFVSPAPVRLGEFVGNFCVGMGFIVVVSGVVY
jgi:hypothetical protein